MVFPQQICLLLFIPLPESCGKLFADVFERYTFVCASANFGGANMLITPYSTTGTLPNVQIVN